LEEEEERRSLSEQKKKTKMENADFMVDDFLASPSLSRPRGGRAFSGEASPHHEDDHPRPNFGLAWAESLEPEQEEERDKRYLDVSSVLSVAVDQEPEQDHISVAQVAASSNHLDSGYYYDPQNQSHQQLVGNDQFAPRAESNCYSSAHLMPTMPMMTMKKEDMFDGWSRNERDPLEPVEVFAYDGCAADCGAAPAPAADYDMMSLDGECRTKKLKMSTHFGDPQQSYEEVTRVFKHEDYDPMSVALGEEQ